MSFHPIRRLHRDLTARAFSADRMATIAEGGYVCESVLPDLQHFKDDVMWRSWLSFLHPASTKHEITSKELLGRTDRVFESWREAGFERPFVETVLRFVETTQDYPNHFFLPTDRLSSVIDDGVYDFSSCDLVRKLTEQFAIQQSAFDRAMKRDATMQTLIECVKSSG